MKYPSGGLQELELARIEGNCKTAKKFPPEKKITFYLGVDSLIRRTTKIKRKVIISNIQGCSNGIARNTVREG